MRVSVLGFGGAEIGFEQASPDVVGRLLESALDAGLNVIDTAECYLESEELIGRAVAGRRKDYYLFTKVGHPDGFGRDDWSKAGILRSIERSLRRLKTDHVDLVQLHSCDEPVLNAGDAIAALEEARTRGYTRYIGYSGDSRAARHALACGRFDTLQASVSIADQEALELLLPLAREKNVGVIAKRPIANAAWRHGARPENEYHHEYWERLQKLDYDFLRAAPLRQAVSVALRFTLGLPGVHTAIVGTARPERWQENAALVADGLLPDAQVRSIRSRWREVAGASWVGQI
jgi:aryl-alcohol dehydrogenase-like predicted oxidoreductase